MAVKANLEIEGKKYNILVFNYKIKQPTAPNGLPSGKPFDGTIVLTIESDKDILIYDWMISHDAQKDGTITFYNQDGISKFKEIKFQEAYCVLHEERFTSSGRFPMTYTIELSPGNTNYQGSNFTKDWSKPQIDSKNASTFVKEEEDKEKKVTINFDANSSEKNVKFGFDKFEESFRKSYQGKISNLENEYKPIQVYGVEYFPVWISTRKGQTITLKIDKEKKKNYSLFNEIKLADHPDFTFEPANIKDAKEVHITCNKTGSETQIKVEGDGVTVGALNIFYPEPKTVNIDWRFVEISGKKLDENIISSKINFVKLNLLLKKAFNAMLIDFNIENQKYKTVDLSKENLTGVIYKEGETEYILRSRKGSFTAFTENASAPSTTSLTLYFANRVCMDKENAAIDEGAYNAVAGFSATNSGIAYGILADKEGKILPEAIAHEIMHALGLEHTFELQNNHIFKGKSTENYMDYSVSKKYTWKYQWEIVRNSKLSK